MGNLQILLLGWILMAVLMLALYLRQRRTENATAVDVGWAGGIGFLSGFILIFGEGNFPRRLLVCGLGMGWAFLLAWRLFRDRLGAKAEDGRYRNLRETWGEGAQARFFGVYQLQGFLSVLFAIPIALAATAPVEGFHLWDLVGIAIWTVAVGGEAVADMQLQGFKAREGNRGKTCRIGLWRYSRHPNYFFEWLHWFAYVAFSVGTIYAWVNVIFPCIMLLFILKISGIPPSERQAILNRGDDYRRYQKTTSPFFPWFPKEEG